MNDAPDDVPDAVPVTIITGYLGSGKTTLLNHLLADARMADTAVLINEFGDVGVDHLLVKQLTEDIVLLNSGCLCCTVRGDLSQAMRDLLKNRADGSVPNFKRLVIETTGLADPAPIIHTLMTDPLIGGHYRLDGIVTTVDALLGDQQLDQFDEAIKQAAVADRLIITKTDLADSDALDSLQTRLRKLNPAAPILAVAQGDVAPDAVLDAGLFSPSGEARPERWLAFVDDHSHDHSHAHDHDHNHDHAHDHDHDDTGAHLRDQRIRSFCVEIDRPIVWDDFINWLDMLLSTRGESMLRVKGILNVEGNPCPVAVHGVQHVFHPPATLAQWPTQARTSKLVFITRDLGEDAVRQTLDAFLTAH